MKTRPNNTGICIVLCIVFLNGCSSEQQTEQAKKYWNEKLECPSPAISQFEPSGKSGSQHVCNIKHGPIVVFENGYIHMRGQYENGKQVGVWTWYGADGKVEKTEDFSKIK